MTWKTNAGLTILFAILTANPARAQAQPSQRGAAIASQICANCHGPRGNSPSSAFPKLAGQQKDYLTAQLKAFRDHTRADPMAQAFMWGMASQLTDDAIADLAAYYASQKPAPGKRPDVKLARQGRDIFEKGIPSEKVPPCMTCHGPHAEGNGPMPRLAGQHSEYLLKQLAMFKTQVRSGANSPQMHVVTGAITFEQMAAVAAYASRPEPK